MNSIGDRICAASGCDDWTDSPNAIYCEEHWCHPPEDIRQEDFEDVGCVKCGWIWGTHCRHPRTESQRRGRAEAGSPDATEEDGYGRT